MEESSSHQIGKVANTVSFLSLSDQHRSSLLSGIYSNSIVVAFTLENHFFQNLLACVGSKLELITRDMCIQSERCKWKQVSMGTRHCNLLHMYASWSVGSPYWQGAVSASFLLRLFCRSCYFTFISTLQKKFKHTYTIIDMIPDFKKWSKWKSDTCYNMDE